MAPFYAEMCDELGQSVDKKLLSDLKQKNKDKIAELDKKIADAEELEGNFQVKNSKVIYRVNNLRSGHHG